MSSGYNFHPSIPWITLQLLFVLLIGLHQTMGLPAPYISDFEYSPEFHPSRNPSCPRRWARGDWEEPRSPEEGGPVGQEPSIEIRAVLVRCPKSQEEMVEVPTSSGNMYNITAGRSQDILEFHGFDKDEPAHHSEVGNCRRKLVVTMKFNNIGKTRTQEEFVVVDHVLDPVTMHKARLLNPFVFKVRQEQVLQLYGLKFQSVVNGEAKEEVINKKSANFTGCDDSLVNPTCGQMMSDGKPIPYSQGFCCSCDPDVNVARQPTDQRSETLSMGNFQKIIPDRSGKQSSGTNDGGSSDSLAPLFANPKTSAEELFLKEDSKSYVAQSLKNPTSLSKRERSLKSSQTQSEPSDDEGVLPAHQNPSHGEDNRKFLKHRGAKDVISKKNVNEIHFEEDYPSVRDFLGGDVSSALGVALSEQNPSRGKIEPYIDAVREEGMLRGAKIIGENAAGLSSIKENVDNDIFRGFKRSGRRKANFSDDRKVSKEKYRELVPKIGDSELTAELVELEREYESLKKSRKRSDAVAARRMVSNNGALRTHSECKDFRKLARGRDQYFGPDISPSNITVGSDIRPGEDSESVSLMKSTRSEGGEDIIRGEISPGITNYNVKPGGKKDRLKFSRKNNPIDQSERRENPSGELSPEIRSFYSLNKNNETSESNSSSSPNTLREKLNPTSAAFLTASNLSHRSSPSITAISSNNTGPISNPAPTYPTLILRQELANDKLYSPLISGDIPRNESTPTNVKKNLRKSAVPNSHLVREMFSGNSGTPERSGELKDSRQSSPLEERNESVKLEPIKLRGSLKDQYADWVIKYAKMHSNHYINSEYEEPLRRYDADLGLDSYTDSERFGWSQDSLSHIADKVLKEFESADENEANLSHEGVDEEVLKRPVPVAPASVQTLNNPGLSEGSENLRSPHFDSAIPRYDEELERGEKRAPSKLQRDKIPEQLSNQSSRSTSSERHNELPESVRNSSKTWRGILSTKIEDPNGVRPFEKLLRRSSEENSTGDSRLAKIEDSGNQSSLEDRPEESVKKAIEPAEIVRGSGDTVKSDFPHQDQSATVIAESATDKDFLFLNKNGREKRLRSLKSHGFGKLMNLREYLKSDASDNSRLHSMGKKLEEAMASDDRDAKDESVKEKFNRLDDLVRDSLRSRRRSFRSIAYDDPFHRNNDEKEAKIDEQIEREFTEITEALNEPLEGQKKAEKLSSLRASDSSEDSMLRDFAVMLNSIPKNDELKSPPEIEDGRKGIARLKNHRVPGNSARRTGQRGFARNSRKRKQGNKHRKDESNRISANIMERKMSDKTSPMGPKKLGARKFSPIQEELGGQKTGYEVSENDEFGTHESVVELPSLSNQAAIGSSTSKYIRASDRVGAEESQTNMNEIVKEIFENDYVPPPSLVGKQEEYERQENIAAAEARNETNEKPGSGFSLESILRDLHIGKLGKKCHQGTTPLLYDDDKYDGATLPPDESTVITTVAGDEGSKTTTAKVIATRIHDADVSSNTGSEDALKKGEGTLSSEETATVPKNSPGTTTGSKTAANFGAKTHSVARPGPTDIPATTRAKDPGESGRTNPEMLETEISIDAQDFTTPLPTRTRSSSTGRSSSSGIIDGLKKFSHMLRDQKIHESDREIIGSADHAWEREGHTAIERSPINFGNERLDGSERSPINFGNERLDEIDATTWTQNADELRKDDQNEGMTGRSRVNDEMMPTTIINDEETVSGTENDEILTVYQETTNSGETTTNTQERHDSTESAFTTQQLTTDFEQSRTSEVGITTSVVDGSFPSPQTLDGLGQMLRFNNTGGSSLILVKTYSVSQNPREFLENYQFPEGVRKVLLKKLNVTTSIHDPVDFNARGSFNQKVNKLVINEEEDADDSETRQRNIQVPHIVAAKIKKVSFEKSIRDSIDGREAFPEKSSRSKKLGMSNADASSGLKNRRTIHEPSIDDLKLQQFQQDSYKNAQFFHKNKNEVEGDNGAVDFDLMMNGADENPDSTGTPKDEFVRNYGLKVTRSFTAVDNLPPGDETTHFSSGDDVNATNSRLDYIMEEPIFAQQSNDHAIRNRNTKNEIDHKNSTKRSVRNLEGGQDRGVEFFYDYDLDSNVNEVKRFYRSTDIRRHQNDERTIGHRGNREEGEKSSAKTGNERLGERDLIKRGKDLGKHSFIANRGASCTGEMSKADKISGITSRDHNGIETGTELVCSDGTDGKWRGKMDLLKLKKHQDVLKEYLNWRPSIDTTVMRIFSIYSTSEVSPTMDNSLGRQKNTQDAPTMSILLIEEGPEEKSRGDDQNSSKDSEIGQLNDTEILDRLSKTPIDDNLMIISVIDKNKLNTTDADGSGEDIDKPKRSGKKKRHGGRSVRSKLREKLDGDIRPGRNINYSRGEARGSGIWKGRRGRRLMSAVQMSENKDNGFGHEDGMPEEKEEALPEYEDLVPRGDASRFDYLDSSYKKHKRDKLKSNWDQLVDKIIVNNNNDGNDPSGKKRNSNKEPEEEPDSEEEKEKSAMEKLHFFDADKYIKLMAKKISRLGSLDITEQDPTTEKQDRINKSRKSTELDDKGDQRTYLSRISSEKADDQAAAFAEDEKGRAFEEEIPYETESLVKDSPSSQGSFFEKLGSDFEISISGKVHINDQAESQPMSISIDGLSMDNGTLSGDRNRGNVYPAFSQTQIGPRKKEADLRMKQGDHLYFDNFDTGHVLREDIPANSYEKKERFFGEAGVVESPKVTSIKKNRDPLISEGPEISGMSTSPRKTFYNVVLRAHPRYEKGPVQSTREFTGAGKSSEDFSDDAEAEELRDSPENDPEKSSENLTVDGPVFDFAKLELHNRKPPALNKFGEETSPFFNQLGQPSFNDEINEDLAKGANKNSHPHRRRARRLRQERAMRHIVPEEAENRIEHRSEKSAGSTSDVKLVELIPVEILNENEDPVVETRQRSSLERKPVDLITSELPKTDIEPGTIPAPKKSKIKPVRHVIKNLSGESVVLSGNADRRAGDDFAGKKNPESLEKMRSEPRRTIVELLKSVSAKASRNSNFLSLKNKDTLDTRESGGLGPQQAKIYNAASPKFVSKIAEPCFGEKGTATIFDTPGNLTGKNPSLTPASVMGFSVDGEPKKLKEERNKVRLSTDDLRPPASRAFGKNDEILIKGVKISSPGENPHDTGEQEEDLEATACGGGECEVCDDTQDSRKTIELKNLMNMMNFIKKLEDILPESDDEEEMPDETPDPETVVEVQSVLLIPEDALGIQPGGNVETEQQTTSERVVVIREGLRHEEGRRDRVKGNNLDVVVIGDPSHAELQSVEKDLRKNLNPEKSGSLIAAGKDKGKSSAVEDQAISDPGISRSDSRPGVSKNYETIEDVIKNVAAVKDENKSENATKVEALFRRVQKKIKQRLLGLEKKANSSGDGFSPVNSLRSHVRTRSSVEKKVKSHPDDVLNLLLENRMQEKSLRKMTEDRDRNELPEIVVRPIKFGEASSGAKNKRFGEYDLSVSEVNKIDDIPEKEGSVQDIEREERRVAEVAVPRQNRQLDRQARTPLRDAVGVSEMGSTGLKGTETKEPRVKNDGVVHSKEKRRTRNLARGKTAEGGKRKKRRWGRKKKKKKKKKRKKKKKKKKKWWPFKRSLLAVFDDQEYLSGGTKRKKKFGDQVQPMNPFSERCDKKEKPKRRKKRQIKAGGSQIRGGQDCMDRRHPAHVNSAKYQESAHCLRFSELWYSAYELETPITEHTVYLQLFEKHTLPDGTTHWDDLTQGSMVRLGTFVRHQRDSAPTISFVYSGAKTAPQTQAHNLDPGKDRLLVPSPVAEDKSSKYPEVKGGSGEYLVVQSNAINGEGNYCDKAGVGFSTFATQPNRCGRPKGTCLKNQPLAYRRHDVEAREAGRPGCYFLSNFASVPNNPIKYNVSGSGSREYLGLEYHSFHVSAIDIEVRADYNAIVRVGSSGRVTEVYVDSTAPEHTLVTIVVSNMGLASSPYQSRISDCPTGLPVSWSKAKGVMQVVPPQHDQRITLDLYGQLFLDGFHCSVEVVNHRGELVAMRRIRVQKMDRCFCVWHCLCACVGSVSGLGCQPMSPEHYHAAGFQGPVPVASWEKSDVTDAIEDMMAFSGAIVLILVGSGMLKWLIGIFVPVVGRWGLDVLLAGSQMVGYFEPELCCRSIVTDCEGKPVHPDTGMKSVRICSRRSEFFVNLTFFLTYPIAVCCNCARSSLDVRKRSRCQDESKVCLLKEEPTPAPGCSKLICVNTYGDSRNSKMEAEDTRYVINELKRSRDSLQDGIGRRTKALRQRTKESQARSTDPEDS